MNPFRRRAERAALAKTRHPSRQSIPGVQVWGGTLTHDQSGRYTDIERAGKLGRGPECSNRDHDHLTQRFGHILIELRDTEKTVRALRAENTSLRALEARRVKTLREAGDNLAAVTAERDRLEREQSREHA